MTKKDGYFVIESITPDSRGLLWDAVHDYRESNCQGCVPQPRRSAAGAARPAQRGSHGIIFSVVTCARRSRVLAVMLSVVTRAPTAPKRAS